MIKQPDKMMRSLDDPILGRVVDGAIDHIEALEDQVQALRERNESLEEEIQYANLRVSEMEEKVQGLVNDKANNDDEEYWQQIQKALNDLTDLNDRAATSEPWVNDKAPWIPSQQEMDMFTEENDVEKTEEKPEGLWRNAARRLW